MISKENTYCIEVHFIQRKHILPLLGFQHRTAKMRENETLQEKALRVIHGFDTKNNSGVPAIISLVAYDRPSENAITDFIWPSETDNFLQSSSSDDWDEEEARLDLETEERQHREFLGDRDQFESSLEDLLDLDQMKLEYNVNQIIDPTPRTISPSPSLTAEPIKITGSSESPTNVIMYSDDEILVHGEDIDPFEMDDVVKPISRPILQVSYNASFESSGKSLASTNTESDVSTVFSTASTATMTPKLLQLKARKRRLERFLSEKSLELSRPKNQVPPPAFDFRDLILPSSIPANAY